MTDRKLTLSNGDINLIVSGLSRLRLEAEQSITKYGRDEALKYGVAPEAISELLERVSDSPEQQRRREIRREMTQELADWIDGDAENGPRMGVETPSEAEFQAEIDRRMAEEKAEAEMARRISDERGPVGGGGEAMRY